MRCLLIIALLLGFKAPSFAGVTHATKALNAGAGSTNGVEESTNAIPHYVLRIQKSRRMVGTVTYNVAAQNLQAAEWIIFASVAPELTGQANVKTRLVPTGVPVKDKSPLARDLLMARVPAKTPSSLKDLSIHITYSAQLFSRTLRPLHSHAAPENVPTLKPDEKALCLAAHGDLDFEQASFSEWLKAQSLVRKPAEDEVDFGRRAFQKIKSSMTYAYHPSMNRHASFVCHEKEADCGGLSSLFVAIMRANGIPAHMLYGRWAESAVPNTMIGEIAYYQWHVKAEFFAEGVGWVPLDLSSAVLYDRSPEGLKYFGSDPGDFIAFHTDTDFEIETKLFGRQAMHNLQEPAWWVSGKGDLKDIKIKEDWKVKP